MELVPEEAQRQLSSIAEQIGMLWLNFLALQGVLRICNAGLSGEMQDSPRLLKDGDIVPLDTFYNCDSLYNTIEKFQKIFKHDPRYRAQDIELDKEQLTKVRNAFAHGYTRSPWVVPIKLINLDPIPDEKTKVKVVFAEDISVDFLKPLNKSLFDQITKLVKLSEQLAGRE